MSEKIYDLLLRLYPSSFRKQYGEEALEVFRNRLQDERGILKKTRLWLDVLLDLFLSAPREHRRVPPSPVWSTSGVPSFLVLEDVPLRPNRFLYGAVLALLALGTFGYLLTHGGNRVYFPGMPNEPLRSLMGPAASADTTGESHPVDSESAASKVPALTPVEQQFVIRKVIDMVRKYDPYRTESQSIAALLEQHESRGDYEEIRSGPVFAVLLTQQMSAVTEHMRVTVMCGQEPVAGSPAWFAPSRPGASAFQRINEHFSVALAPLQEAENRR